MAIVISLILAECATRLYLYGGKGFSYVELNSFKNLGQSNYIQRAENDSILWELKPNLDTLFKFKQFSTNEFGMRDRSYSKQKPPNTKRIVVIGDSYAMGSGVADHESYATLIEDMFAKQYSEINIEVLNFGVGGYGLRNYDAVLRSKAMLFDPDLVIIGFSDNDHELPKQAELEGKLRLGEPAEMFYMSHLKNLLVRKVIRRKLFRQIDRSNQDELAHVENHFTSIISQCNKKGIPAIIAYYPLIYNEVTTEFYKEKSEESGFYFVNAAEGLEDIPERKIRVNLLDNHPNELGHQVYADNIYEFIIGEGLLPLNH